MSSEWAVVFCLAVASLQVGVNCHHKGDESSLLVSHTHKAQHTLDSLTSSCSSGVSQLILVEETKATELLETCSKSTIILQTTELLTDSAYFGFSLLNHGITLFSDFKQCYKENNLVEKIVCAIEKAPGAVKSAIELLFSAISYLLQLKDFLPKIESEIKECKSSTISEYQQSLDRIVNKAIMC